MPGLGAARSCRVPSRGGWIGVREREMGGWENNQDAQGSRREFGVYR